MSNEVSADAPIVVDVNNSVDAWEDFDDNAIDFAVEGDDTEVEVDEISASNEDTPEKEKQEVIEEDIKEDKPIEEDKELEEEDKPIDNEKEGDLKSELTLESVQGSLEDGSYESTIKVDGKEEIVSLKELKSNYSGKVAYDKKFTELDKRDKINQAEYKKINTVVDNFANGVKEGDILSAFSKVGEFAKIPSYILKEQLIAALTPEINRRAGLSEDQINNESLTEQNKYLKESKESENKKLISEQATSALNNKVNSIRETHKIEDVEWTSAIKTLDERLPKDQPITPELVQEEILSTRIDSRAVELLTKYDAPLGGNADWIKSLKEIINQNPDFTDEDVNDIIETAAKQSGYKSTTSKLKNKLSKNTPTKKKVSESSEEEEIDQDLADLFAM